MPTLKNLLNSRTIQFSIALAVLSVLQGFVFHLPLPPAVQAFVGCMIAIAVVVLRAITTMPLKER
jgi:uncharacterized MnhB-related membrane protein